MRAVAATGNDWTNFPAFYLVVSILSPGINTPGQSPGVTDSYLRRRRHAVSPELVSRSHLRSESSVDRVTYYRAREIPAEILRSITRFCSPSVPWLIHG